VKVEEKNAPPPPLKGKPTAKKPVSIKKPDTEEEMKMEVAQMANEFESVVQI
jgi:hypothetical protein